METDTLRITVAIIWSALGFTAVLVTLLGNLRGKGRQ